MNWEIILSIVTIVLSVVAICISIQQTRLSNKQSLFDRRLSLYMLVDEIMTLYGQHSNLLKNEKEFTYVSYHFVLLVNSSTLEECSKVIDNPIEGEGKKFFLKKREELYQKAKELEFVWKEDNVSVLSNFIRAYVNLLSGLYQQQIIINGYKPKSTDDDDLDLEKFKKECCLWAKKNGLYSTVKMIDELYNKIKDKKILEEFAKEIKL